MTNKAILEKANAAIAAGRYDDFLAFCAEDTHWTFVGDKVLEGKEAVRQWLASEYLEPPDNRVAHLIAEDDLVTAVGEITVKHRDGKVANYSYCDVWRLRQGKLAELRAFVVES